MNGKRERDIKNIQTNLSVCTVLEPVNYVHRDFRLVDPSTINICSLPAIVDVSDIMLFVFLDRDTKTIRFAIYNYLPEKESIYPGPESLARTRSREDGLNLDHHQARTYTSMKTRLELSS